MVISRSLLKSARQLKLSFLYVAPGGNPFGSFSPEDGKTGIERPSLGLGLPNFRYWPLSSPWYKK